MTTKHCTVQCFKGAQLPPVADRIQHSITAKNLKDSILLWFTGYFPLYAVNNLYASAMLVQIMNMLKYNIKELSYIA